MNIAKTNKVGLNLIKTRFSVFKNIIKNITETASSNTLNNYSEDSIALKLEVFRNHREQKILRLSTNVLNACRAIELSKISENITMSDFNFTSLIILLDNDKSGLIKVYRTGSDFNFIYMSNLDSSQLGSAFSLNTYSFLTKEFGIKNVDLADAEFVVQVLAYIYYGDITTNHLKSKTKKKLSFYHTVTNTTKFDIVYVDSLWRQRINTDGFKVSGHFRLQPVGENRSKRKLIWIESFNKSGYNRKATVELTNK